MGYLLIGLMLGMAVLVAVVLILWMIIERAGRQRQSLFQQRGVITDATVESSSGQRFRGRLPIVFMIAMEWIIAASTSWMLTVTNNRLKVAEFVWSICPINRWISGLRQTWLQARASVR
jgi:hypothetical protein